jgi:Kef-type K+ transport system membrane component KefB
MNLSQVAMTFAVVAGTLLVCFAFGRIAAALGQPAMIGELLGGVLLGPTLLGSWSSVLLPGAVRPQLTMLGNLGVALFMLVLGLEFGSTKRAGRARRAGVIAAGSVAVPFVFGAAFGVLLILWGYGSGGHTGFALFMGVAMSVTAFPVLARLLEHRRLTGTELGRLAITVAAISDVLAWTLLAVVIAIVGSGGHASWLVCGVVPLVLALHFVVTPILRKLFARTTGVSRAGLTAVLAAGALATGAITEAIGLHFILGAFLFGAEAARAISAEQLASARRALTDIGALFLPVYFLSAGLTVDLSLSPAILGLILLALTVAVGGKIGGTFAAAKVLSLPTDQATTLAVLMNTRGLTELIVLTTGLQLGVLSPRLYSIMVVVALCTTVVTNPALSLLDRRRSRALPVTREPALNR